VIGILDNGLVGPVNLPLRGRLLKLLLQLFLMVSLLFVNPVSAYRIVKATASSVEIQDSGKELLAKYAVDGSMSTRWSSEFSDPQWLRLDLGSKKEINNITLRWEDAYATAYEIQLSNDGQNWETVYTENFGTGGVDSITLNHPQTARFIRYTLLREELNGVILCGKLK